MRTHRGFTLVELIVVVSIIVLIVSLVMPMYDQAQMAGERVVCQSRLHQIHIAAMTYATDNKMIGVRLKHGKISYSDELFPYLYANVTDKANTGIDTANDGIMDSSFYKTTNFYRCPTVELLPTIGSTNGQILDFGMNHYGRGNSDTDKFFDTMSAIRITSVKNSTVVYFADADAGSSPEDIGGISRGTWEWPIRYSFERYAWRRHLDGYNMVQLGGAAGWHPGGTVAMNEAWLIFR
ncbi:MAG: prepilin-type N-terminal cleavage/methylation domain-containing protein [Phycisphaera sp.]|nr:prepilin-type N-terminal cleavage/methylation domain-containing protein [Phycisphaera sp.]